jgi:hypothetical protein
MPLNEATIKDTPGWGGTSLRGKERVLLIAITLVSGKDCGCKKASVTRYVYHIARIGKDGSVEQNTAGSGNLRKGKTATDEQRKAMYKAKRNQPPEATEGRGN